MKYEGPTYLATAHYTLVLVIAKGTLVAYSNKRCRPNVTIADRTFAITLVAESSYRYARLLTAHDQIAAPKVSKSDNGSRM